MNIDLSEEWDDCCVPCCGSKSDEEEKEKHYPTVYLRGKKNLADIPPKGRITFEFERDEVTVTSKGEQPVRTVLKLKAIVDAVDGSSVEMDSGDAIDALLRQMDSGREELED